MTEEQEQVLLFQWARGAQGKHPELALLHAIPNGGYRTPATAAHMKRQGVKSGVPDMCLPVARGGYHGLYIELKRTDGGRVSEPQRWWLERLEAEGYAAAVCHGFDEAQGMILAYLEG